MTDHKKSGDFDQWQREDKGGNRKSGEKGESNPCTPHQNAGHGSQRRSGRNISADAQMNRSSSLVTGAVLSRIFETTRVAKGFYLHMQGAVVEYRR